MKKKGAYWQKHMRKRGKSSSGQGQRLEVKARSNVDDIGHCILDYLDALGALNYSQTTIEGRRKSLHQFWVWCNDRDLLDAGQVTRPTLESYQRHLYRYRKSNGQPLGFSTQSGYLVALREFFKWCTRQNRVLHNPASELELPRPTHKLPPPPLTQNELKRIFAQPNLKDLFGYRDRVMLELFYATGIRRSELVRLDVQDVMFDSNTLRVREGKGRKDRYLPLGKGILPWLKTYLSERRPELVYELNESAMFLSGHGSRLNADALGRIVKNYFNTARIEREGACHLFRHTCATLMHENGADIRYIQQMLGHSKLDTTQLYTSVSIRELRAVYERTHPAGGKRRGT